MTEILWLFAVAGGPILLGGAIIYALVRQRRLSASEKAAQSREAERLFREN